MTIGIDASRANRDQKTGVEWYAFYIIQEFKTIIPEDIQVILYSEVPLHGELAVLPKNWESNVLSWPPKRLWTQVRLSFEMLTHAPDILFIPAHVFPLIHPKKTIMTIHDTAAAVFPESFNWFERWYSLWTARYAVTHLWKVIVPSKVVQQAVGNSHVVHHGYDEAFGAPQKKMTIDKPYILSIGRLEEKKNTRRMIEAFDIYCRESYDADTQLVLIGKPGYGYEAVGAAIEQSPYKERIIQQGWVKPEDIPGIMQGAKLFLFPSVYEGFGIPVLEAFVAETPVIASKGSALEEVGGDAALYVDPLDANDIAQKMKELMTNEALRHTLVKKGGERVQAFSWSKAARETLQLMLF